MPSGDLEKFIQAFDSVRDSFQSAMKAFNQLVVQIEDNMGAGAQGAEPLRKLTGEHAAGAESAIFTHQDYSAELVLSAPKAPSQINDPFMYHGPDDALDAADISSPYLDVPIALHGKVMQSGENPSTYEMVGVPGKISKRATGDAFAVVQHFVKGKSKERVLSYHRTLACHMLQALAAMHAKEAVHRDVKLLNILYFEGSKYAKECFKLTDFSGICHVGENGKIESSRDKSRVYTSAYVPADYFSYKPDGTPFIKDYAELNLKTLDLYALGFSLLYSLFLSMPDSHQSALEEKMKSEQRLQRRFSNAKTAISLIKNNIDCALEYIEGHYQSDDFSELTDLIDKLVAWSDSPPPNLSEGDQMAQDALRHSIFKLTSKEIEEYEKRDHSKIEGEDPSPKCPEYLDELQRGEHSVRVGIDGYWVSSNYLKYDTRDDPGIKLSDQKPRNMSQTEWRALFRHLRIRPKEKPARMEISEWERLRQKWQQEEDYSVLETSAESIAEVTNEEWARWKARSDAINADKQKLIERDAKLQASDDLFYRLPAELKAVVEAYEKLASAVTVLAGQFETREWSSEEERFILCDKPVSNFEKLVVQNKIAQVCGALENAKRHGKTAMVETFYNSLQPKLEVLYRSELFKISTLDLDESDAVLNQFILKMLHRSKPSPDKKTTAAIQAGRLLFHEALEKLREAFAGKKSEAGNCHRLFASAGQAKKIGPKEKWQLLNDLLSATACGHPNVRELLGDELIEKMKALKPADAAHVRVHLKEVLTSYLSEDLYIQPGVFGAKGDITLKVDALFGGQEVQVAAAATAGYGAR